MLYLTEHLLMNKFDGSRNNNFINLLMLFAMGYENI